MEDQIRFLYYTDIFNFANNEDLAIVFPANDPAADTDADGNFNFQEIEGEDIFLRPRIVSFAPYYLGRITGAATYKWHVQVSIYTKNNLGELDAARVFDKLRTVFRFGDKKSDGSRIYTQMSNMRAESPVAMANFIALPTMFDVQSIS